MLFIFDMDGVVWRGDEPVPYAADAVAALRGAGHTVRFLTNNSARTRGRFVSKLKMVGISAVEEEVATSSSACALYFVAQGWEGIPVYAIGRDGLREELAHIARCTFVEDDSEYAEAVVVGIDWDFTYEKLRVAQQHVLRGAHFLCTNRDPTFPVEGGRVVPGAGTIVAAVEVASGRTPINVGKPNAYSIHLLAGETGTPLSETVVIGDRLDTDIDAGLNAGARTLLVMTGVTTQGEVDALPPERRPEIVLPDLSHLPAEWTAV